MMHVYTIRVEFRVGFRVGFRVEARVKARVVGRVVVVRVVDVDLTPRPRPGHSIIGHQQGGEACPGPRG
jgi:hypothetical protein